MLKLIWSVIRMRCIRCRRGRVWKRLMAMNARCPVCDYLFEREEGYFYGAMYASYFLAMATVIPVMFFLLLTDRPMWLLVTVTTVQTLVQAPVSFMYSRVIWMAVDNAIDPFPVWDGTHQG